MHLIHDTTNMYRAWLLTMAILTADAEQHSAEPDQKSRLAWELCQQTEEHIVPHSHQLHNGFSHKASC